MVAEAEILVHIAAPSTSTDDTLYRAFAQAYLDFEPGRRVELPLPQRSLDEPPSTDDVLLSPQLSFNSVWENIRSPALAKVKTSDGCHPKATENALQEERASQQSWVPPPSELPDSMPDNDISMDGFNTPTRILNYFLQSTEAFLESSQETDNGGRDITIYDGNGNFTTILAQNTPLGKSIAVENSTKAHHSPLQEPVEETIVLGTPTDSPPNDSPLADALEETTVLGAPAYPLLHAHHHRELLGEATVVEAPVTPSALQKRPIPAALSSDQTQPSIIDASLRSSSQTGSHDRMIPSTQLSGRAYLEPPSSKRPRLNCPNPPIKGLGRSASDILPWNSHNFIAITASRNSSRDEVGSAEPLAIDWSGETQILSIEPAPSNHKLGPKPPAYLELFVKKMGMSSWYKPKFQACEMRPYERGYWLLDLSGWENNAKFETWDFLGNFIRRDSCAGWGTRACRDEQWGWIRLYGWEHIAGELYILLYVATYQRTKYMELTWYDGAGKELIIVGARADKSTGR